MKETAVWEDMTVEERDALVARVLGWSPTTPGERPPAYTDAGTPLRLIESLAAERRVTAIRIFCTLWPDAWSLFFETTVAGAGEEIHVIGDTLPDAIAKGSLTLLHDVDVDLLYADRDGSPSEQRAIDVLREPVARRLGWALIADMDHDLLAAYRRLGDVTGLTRDDIAALFARELRRTALANRPPE